MSMKSSSNIVLDYGLFRTADNSVNNWSVTYDNTVRVLETGVSVKGLYMFKAKELPIVVRKSLKIELLYLTPGTVICDFIEFDLSRSEGRSAMRSYEYYMNMFGMELDHVVLHNRSYDIYLYTGDRIQEINRKNYLNPGDWLLYDIEMQKRKEEEIEQLRHSVANFIT